MTRWYERHVQSVAGTELGTLPAPGWARGRLQNAGCPVSKQLLPTQPPPACPPVLLQQRVGHGLAQQHTIGGKSGAGRQWRVKLVRPQQFREGRHAVLAANNRHGCSMHTMHIVWEMRLSQANPAAGPARLCPLRLSTYLMMVLGPEHSSKRME